MSVLDEVRDLLEFAVSVADSEQAERLRAIEERLESPLRLAIAGRVKAGKSTLLNALVGEAVAPTDAAECTKVVTWFVDGLTYRAWLHPRGGGAAAQVPFTREPGDAHIDVSGTPLDDIDHLEVEFPSRNLAEMDVIDTPGTASLSESVSARADDFLLADAGTHVDVVIYLLRHLHDRDVDFLEAFADERGDVRPTMAIGVLSRADEIGGGRSDAMWIAQRAAAAIADEPRIRTRVQSVLPVAGLLAFAAATLREEEFQHLRVLARSPIVEIDAALASVDTYIDGVVIGLGTEAERRAMVERFGLHGIRFAVAAILHRNVSSSVELARALEAHSGLQRLRSLVAGLYAERQSVIKASLAMTVIEEVARSAAPEIGRKIEGELERIRATSHELAELKALNELRIHPPSDLPDETRLEAERILGAEGADVFSRLGLAGDYRNEDVRGVLLDAITSWRRTMDQPLVSREMRMLTSVVLQSLERLYALTPD